MDFAISDDQQMLKNLVERFVGDRCPLAERPHHAIPDAGRDAANWALLAEVGLLALPFSECAGGLGGGRTELITVMEAFGRGLAAEPYLSDILLAGGLLERAGTAAQTAHWLERIATGQASVALAHAEAEARFLLSHVATTATPGADGARLTGRKTFVAAGGATDAFIVSAREKEIGPIRLYLVAADAEGLTRTPYRLLDGSTAEELTLDGVVGEPMAGGLAELEAQADIVRLAASAEMLGVMETLFAATLEYLKTRKQFGVALGSFQALQHRMADQFAALEMSRSMVYRAAAKDETEFRTAVAATKAYVSEAALKLAEEAVQMHGGMGVSDELIVGHGLKRILVLASLFGDADAELSRYRALSGATA